MLIGGSPYYGERPTAPNHQGNIQPGGDILAPQQPGKSTALGRESYRKRKEPKPWPMKMAEFELLFGSALNRNGPLRIEDELLKFDFHHRKLGIVLAVGAIASIATGAGAAVGLAVDEIAHLTDRKNDNVGLVVGTLIALLLFGTHATYLFGVHRRLQMYLGTGEMRRDAHNSGQSRVLMFDHALPLLKMMERNFGAIKGLTQQEMRMQPIDIYRTLNTIFKHSVPKSTWKHYLIETKTQPSVGPWYQCQISKPHVDLKAGYYYRSRYDSADELLNHDWIKAFDPVQHEMKLVLTSYAAKIKAQFPKLQQKLDNDKLNGVSLEDVRDEHTGLLPFVKKLGDDSFLLDNTGSQATDFAHYQDFKLTRKEYDHLENFVVAEINGKLKTADDYSHQMVLRGDHLGASFTSQIRAQNPELDDAGFRRSWVRVDEFEKISNGYTGLRPASMSTMWRNLTDSLTFGARRSGDAVAQSANAGLSFPMYLPMMCIGSVTTILGLGISSTPAVAPINGVPLSESAKKKQAAELGTTTITATSAPMLVAGGMSESARGQLKSNQNSANTPASAASNNAVPLSTSNANYPNYNIPSYANSTSSPTSYFA